jgi:hypothetical protein
MMTYESDNLDRLAKTHIVSQDPAPLLLVLAVQEPDSGPLILLQEHVDGGGYGNTANGCIEQERADLGLDVGIGEFRLLSDDVDGGGVK